MSVSGIKNSAREGLSLQMALLHLRWQQIRQMELAESSEIDSIQSGSDFKQNTEEMYTIL